MRDDYCDVMIVLDESGSMEPLQQDTIGGVNRFLKEQRALPGKCTISLLKFNHGDQPVFTGRPIAEAPDLTVETYQPNGNTALLDALGRTITEGGARLRAMSEADRPSKVIVLVVTDGEENSSHTWTKEKIKEAVERQTHTYKWEFVFLGANVDAFAEAGALGMQGSHTLQTHSTRQSVESSYVNMSLNATRLRSGASSSMAWTDEQRKEQEDTSGEGGT
jgi:hypothetical protein